MLFFFYEFSFPVTVIRNQERQRIICFIAALGDEDIANIRPLNSFPHPLAWMGMESGGANILPYGFYM